MTESLHTSLRVSLQMLSDLKIEVQPTFGLKLRFGSGSNNLSKLVLALLKSLSLLLGSLKQEAWELFASNSAHGKYGV